MDEEKLNKIAANYAAFTQNPGVIGQADQLQATVVDWLARATSLIIQTLARAQQRKPRLASLDTEERIQAYKEELADGVAVKQMLAETDGKLALLAMNFLLLREAYGTLKYHGFADDPTGFVAYATSPEGQATVSPVPGVTFE